MIVARAETGSTIRSRASLCPPVRYSSEMLLNPKHNFRRTTPSCFIRLEIGGHEYLGSRHNGTRIPRIGRMRTDLFQEGSRVPATQFKGRQVAYPLTAALPDDAAGNFDEKHSIIKQGGMLSGFFSKGTLAKIGSVCLVGLDVVGGALFLASAPSWVQGKSLWGNLVAVAYEIFDTTFNTTFEAIMNSQRSAAGNIIEQIVVGFVTTIVMLPIGFVMAAVVAAYAAIGVILQESIVTGILVGLVFGATYFFGGEPAVTKLLVGFRWVCRFSLFVNAVQYAQLSLEHREVAPKIDEITGFTSKVEALGSTDNSSPPK
ncbi:hypothetical protein CYMTET_48160 [Cymbomonas tetramitiformis]|uniref:Uncharacterized protein n=1 Tax=Cymbomonas tetramitiformis TaxID=36881 RepID=A0AAE0BST7_9CHLO|nr:hypothetical protein CYMTET_48160 [Cymbomonas tetramitiformis]